jgi:hypothetical protein
MQRIILRIQKYQVIPQVNYCITLYTVLKLINNLVETYTHRDFFKKHQRATIYSGNFSNANL